MKSRMIFFFVVFLSLAAGVAEVQSSFPQVRELWGDRKLNPNVPSQELYANEFQQSAPAVVWHEWSNYAFSKAFAFDKPILLYISVQWDRNCYRMDTEVFSDPSVAFILNNVCVPIRVDGDERPDIRRAYGAKIWPSIFFLLPDGRPLVWQKEGGKKNQIALGYMNPDMMKSLAIDSFRYYRQNTKKVVELAESEMDLETKQMKPNPGAIEKGIIDRISSTIKANFDLEHGGFGKEPKFPMPFAVEFALSQYSVRGDQAYFEIASRTLDAIMNSELHDKIDGGIFRISENSDWSNPSHEKMIDRNGMLLSNFIDAYMVSGDERFLQDAESILQFVEKKLVSPEGAFYGGQFADFGYSEGYYSAKPDERKELMAPPVDKRIFCDWNAIMVSSLLKASIFMNNASLFEKAMKAADFISEKLYYPGRGAFHYLDENGAHMMGSLEDNALLADMFINLYQFTADDLYIRRAQDIADFIINNLRDIVWGGNLDFLPNEDAPGKLKIPVKSMDNNALAARVMIRLFYMTGKERYLREAAKTLELFSGIYTNFGVSSALYGMACNDFFIQPCKIIIVAKSGDASMQSLRQQANRIPEPWKIIKYLDPDSPEIGSLSLVKAEGSALYFIKESVISSPVTEAAKVLPQFEKFKRSIEKMKEKKEKSNS